MEDFWTWRLATKPDSQDDLTRVERPPDWFPDWSPAAVTRRRETLAAFRTQPPPTVTSAPSSPDGAGSVGSAPSSPDGAGSVGSAPSSPEEAGAGAVAGVDGWLWGSAVDRVEWELNLLREWETNPGFYLDQSLGSVYVLLLDSRPFDGERSGAIVRRLEAVPDVLDAARQNLAGHAAADFARVTIEKLDHAGADLTSAMEALESRFPATRRTALAAATEAAVHALTGYRDWLRTELPGFTGPVAPGREAFGFFLHRVALLPYTADEIRLMARQEWHRATAFEAVLASTGSASPTLFTDTTAQIEQARRDEEAVREFYVNRRILSQPESLRHYHFAPVPEYVAPLSWLGVTDDLTSERRVDETAYRYVPAPRPGLPYFAKAAAEDPRLAIVHEGVHAQQLAMSWAHPNPVRRHFYDSAPNEGIAFYNEELMLQAGLFDDNPASVRSIANMLRLRALRAEVDVALALGETTVDEATEWLAKAVPLDHETAREEAVFFAGNPGQAMSYLIGKLQILDMLSVAAQRDGFDLQAFHDRLWREGNVPLSLQRWEALGLRDHLDRAEGLR
jgi:hypothetical protein